MSDIENFFRGIKDGIVGVLQHPLELVTNPTKLYQDLNRKEYLEDLGTVKYTGDKLSSIVTNWNKLNNTLKDGWNFDHPDRVDYAAYISKHWNDKVPWNHFESLSDSEGVISQDKVTKWASALQQQSSMWNAQFKASINSQSEASWKWFWNPSILNTLRAGENTLSGVRGNMSQLFEDKANISEVSKLANKINNIDPILLKTVDLGYPGGTTASYINQLIRSEYRDLNMLNETTRNMMNLDKDIDSNFHITGLNDIAKGAAKESLDVTGDVLNTIFEIFGQNAQTIIIYAVLGLAGYMLVDIVLNKLVNKLI
jgi:hypothetical protein